MLQIVPCECGCEDMTMDHICKGCGKDRYFPEVDECIALLKEIQQDCYMMRENMVLAEKINKLLRNS